MKKHLLITLAFLVIVALSILTTVIAFPIGRTFAVVERSGTETKGTFYVNPEELDLNTILIDSLQIPPELKWFNFCFENRSEYNELRCFDPEEGSPLLLLKFSDSDEEYVETNNISLERAGGSKTYPYGDFTYEVDAGATGCFLYRSDRNITYSSKMIFGNSEDSMCAVPNDVRVEDYANLNYGIYVVPRIEAILSKFIIIFLFYLFAAGSILSIIRFFDKRR